MQSYYLQGDKKVFLLHKGRKNKANQSQTKPICRSVFVRDLRRIFETRVHIVAIIVKFRYFDRLFHPAV